MAVNRAAHKAACARNVFDRFAPLKAPQRFKLTIVQPGPTRRSQRTAVFGKCPAFICRKIRSDFVEERLGEIFQFLLAHAGNSTKLGWCRRIVPRHLAQRDIRENYVGRYVALIGKSAPQPPELFEEQFIARDRADSATRCSLGDIDLLGQRNWGACAQCFQTRSRKRQRGKSARRAFNETESQQFASNRLPLFTFEIPANAISRKLVVIALPDRFRICTTKNIDNVIQSKSESAFCEDTMDA